MYSVACPFKYVLFYPPIPTWLLLLLYHHDHRVSDLMHRYVEASSNPHMPVRSPSYIPAASLRVPAKVKRRNRSAKPVRRSDSMMFEMPNSSPYAMQCGIYSLLFILRQRFIVLYTKVAI